MRSAKNFCCITRAAELQQNAIECLSDQLEKVSSEKARAISSEHEDYANLLLGFESVINALIAELKTWKLLKEEKPDEAWDQFVTAQMSVVDAARSHSGFEHLDIQAARLEKIESIIFPPQIFLSAGLVVNMQRCSICGEEYEVCEHVIARPYMGEFCNVIAEDIELNHIAIVDEPADKRCRVESFSTESGSRNRMTWLIQPNAEDV